MSPPAVWLISGGQKQKLSTIAIDNELSKLSIEEIEGRLYSLVYAESGAYMMGHINPRYLLCLRFNQWSMARKTINRW